MFSFEALLSKLLVQHNMKHSLAWLVYDLDSENALLEWGDRNAPAPNIAAINPENGHGHLFYGLENPVHNYEKASARALRYMAAVDVALTALLGADPDYSKLISKNPTHPHWRAFLPRIELYDLDELASWLDLALYMDRRRRVPMVGFGRNCTLFEKLRLWAYRERRKEQQYFSANMFQQACMWRGYAINAEFTPPLPHSEVRSTAKSVANWTWRNMSPEGFRKWQKRQSEKGNTVKRQKAQELREAIISTRIACPTLTQTDIASMHNVTQQTVSNHLKYLYKYPISDKEGF